MYDDSNEWNSCNSLKQIFEIEILFFYLVSKVDLQDKEFLTALANHAQALAKVILRRSDSGQHLAEDAQVN